MPEQWTNPEYAGLMKAWRELKVRPEAGDFRGFLIPAAEPDGTDDQHS